MTPTARPLPFVLALTALGVGVGGLVWNWAGAILVGVAGAILAWGLLKGAVYAGLRGALLGAGFCFLVGPGADWLLNSGDPRTQPASALVVGGLVGALLGVRNFRKPKVRPVVEVPE